MNKDGICEESQVENNLHDEGVIDTEETLVTEGETELKVGIEEYLNKEINISFTGIIKQR